MTTVRIYIDNVLNEEFQINEVVTPKQIISKTSKDPETSTVHYSKTHGKGHPYEEFKEGSTLELKNNMSFRVVEVIENGEE